MKNSGIEWIGEIPENWRIIKFKYLYKNSNAGEVIDKGYWNIGEELLYTCQRSPMKSNFSDFPDIKRTTINDLLLTRNATPYIFKPETNAIYSNVVQRVTIKEEFCIDYIQYATQYGISKAIAQGDTIPSYNMQIWDNVYIPNPSIDEQYAIVAYLNKSLSYIDNIIEKQQQVIEKLKEYKLSVITEAVTKGLDPDAEMKDSGVEWIGMIPEKWELCKLRNHTTMLTPMRDKPEDLDGDIPWIRIEDYCGKYIYESKEGFGVSKETISKMNLKVYPVGSILCTSSCDLGKCAIVSKEIVSNQRFINIIPDENTNSDYLYYVMLSNAKRLNHLSTGTIQANLSRVAFEHLLVQFPQYEEQKAIADYLDKKCLAIETAISKKQAILDKLAEYKKSLIYEVVTGKKEV